jgi:Transposase DDE domain group 1
MTECTQSEFQFAAHLSRQVVARFDGGTITTDGGGLLLRETDRRLNLLPRLAACFVDRRDPQLIQHSVQELVSQRVYGLALGYEDLNDHEQLRQDPVLRLMAGKAEVAEQPLARKEHAEPAGAQRRHGQPLLQNHLLAGCHR